MFATLAALTLTVGAPPAPAITAAALTAFVVAATGLLKQFIPENAPNRTYLVRLLAVVVALGAVAGDTYLPANLLNTAISAASVAGAAMLAFPAVSAGTAAVAAKFGPATPAPAEPASPTA